MAEKKKVTGEREKKNKIGMGSNAMEDMGDGCGWGAVGRGEQWSTRRVHVAQVPKICAPKKICLMREI